MDRYVVIFWLTILGFFIFHSVEGLALLFFLLMLILFWSAIRCICFRTYDEPFFKEKMNWISKPFKLILEIIIRLFVGIVGIYLSIDFYEDAYIFSIIPKNFASKVLIAPVIISLPLYPVAYALIPPLIKFKKSISLWAFRITIIYIFVAIIYLVFIGHLGFIYE